MTLGEEILRDKVARVADPVEYLIGQVLQARRTYISPNVLSIGDPVEIMDGVAARRGKVKEFRGNLVGVEMETGGPIRVRPFSRLRRVG